MHTGRLRRRAADFRGSRRPLIILKGQVCELRAVGKQVHVIQRDAVREAPPLRRTPMRTPTTPPPRRRRTTAGSVGRNSKGGKIFHPRAGGGPEGFDDKVFAGRRSIRAARVGRLNESSNLPNLCSHDPTDRLVLACVEAVFKISVAVAPRTGTFRPSMHSATAPIHYSRLLAGVTSSGLCPTAASFGHFRKPSDNVCLTHGVVFISHRPPLALRQR
jgi:hypothetical protein